MRFAISTMRIAMSSMAVIAAERDPDEIVEAHAESCLDSNPSQRPRQQPEPASEHHYHVLCPRMKPFCLEQVRLVRDDKSMSECSQCGLNIHQLSVQHKMSSVYYKSHCTCLMVRSGLHPLRITCHISRSEFVAVQQLRCLIETITPPPNIAMIGPGVGELKSVQACACRVMSYPGYTT